MTVKKKKTLLIIFIVVLVPILFAVYQYHKFTSKFNGSEAALNTEINSLNLPLGTQISSSYRPGVCFDNCPEVTIVYSINPPADKTILGQRLLTVLTEHGYKSTDGLNGTKEKGRFEISINPESSTNDSQITGAEVDIYYNPTISEN